MVERRDQKGPLETLLDLCVFVPAGFLANARELVPDLAAKGREQIDVQVRVARMIGQFVVAKGQQEAGKAAERLRSSPPAAQRQAARAEVPRATAPSAEAPPDAPDGRSGRDAPSLIDEEVIPVRLEDVDPVTAASVGADELAIPGYDSLAASQVVPRLEGLTPRELEAVRRYEVAHRGRKTILGKVAQIQAR